MFRNHPRGREGEPWDIRNILQHAPDSFVSVRIILDIGGRVDNGQMLAAVRQYLGQRRISGKDRGATAHIQPHGLAFDQAIEQFLVIFLRGKIAKSPA